MMELSGPSQPPASGGKPRQLVVLLHGYGRTATT
jgi:predicted esterase